MVKNIVKKLPESSKTSEDICPQNIKDGIIAYCREKMNADGWMGKYMIPPSKRDKWMKTDPKFRELMELVPYIIKDTINEASEIAIQKLTSAENELETQKAKGLSSLVSRFVDIHYRQEKDSGMMKEEADKRRKGKVSSEELSLDDIEDIYKYINDEN